MLDKALQSLGLQAIPTPVSAKDAPRDAPTSGSPSPPTRITLRIHAGNILNTDGHGQPLSVIARIYKLRRKDAFASAPYAQFQELKSTPTTDFASEIVNVNEIVLNPGQQYDVVEALGADAPFIAVVAMFRTPDQKRWRFIFDSKEAASTGVTVGVHGCALSVSAGRPLDVPAETLRVAGVQCPS